MEDFVATVVDSNIVYFTGVDPSLFEVDNADYSQFVPIIRRPPNEGWCSSSSSLPYENS